VIPHLYDGHDNTFYFLSYEGLRLPQQTNVIQSVPTAANAQWRSICVRDADKERGWNSLWRNRIPMSDISSVSQNLLAKYYPLPNTGASTAITNNYQQNFPTPITSDQGDARLDRTITPHQNIYARYSYKQRSVASPPTNSATAGGSALTGTFNKPEKDTSLAVCYITTSLRQHFLNELRGGLSKFITETTFGDSSADFTSLESREFRI